MGAVGSSWLALASQLGMLGAGLGWGARPHLVSLILGNGGRYHYNGETMGQVFATTLGHPGSAERVADTHDWQDVGLFHPIREPYGTFYPGYPRNSTPLPGMSSSSSNN